ncbi:unnamed protein product [Rhodiola kirilowii]
MASSEAGSRLSQALVPALEKIINNASWRKHSKLAHECKSLLEKFASPNQGSFSPPSPTAAAEQDLPGPLHDGGSGWSIRLRIRKRF